MRIAWSLSTGVGLRRHGTRLLAGMNTRFIEGVASKGSCRPKLGDLQRALGWGFAVAATFAAGPASASIFEGNPGRRRERGLMGRTGFVPIVVIVVFWLVHVLPEKIAHKRHHPQFAMRFRPYACCRWSSAACCGRSPGCGPTPSRSVTRWPTAPRSTKSITTKCSRSFVPANCCARKRGTCAKSWRRWKPRVRCRRSSKGLKTSWRA